MNISKLTLPDIFYLNDDLLSEMVEWGIENFALPEEILASFGIPHHWFSYWRTLAMRGDERAKYIVYKLSDVEKKWLAKGRKKVMLSSDTRSISNMVNFYVDRSDRLAPAETQLAIDDDWID